MNFKKTLLILSSLNILIFSAQEGSEKKYDQVTHDHPFFQAINKQDLDSVDNLLKQGQNPNVILVPSPAEPTVLMWAASYSNGIILKRLLKEPNIDLLRIDKFGRNVLNTACHKTNYITILKKAKETLDKYEIIGFILNAILADDDFIVEKFLGGIDILTKEELENLIKALEEIIEEQKAGRTESIVFELKRPLPAVLANLISEYEKPKQISAEKLEKINNLIAEIKKRNKT